MAKNRVNINKNFKATVQSIAIYGNTGIARFSNADRKTLSEIADEIVDEVKEIVDEKAIGGRGRNRGGLPGYVRGGRRNPNYGIRRRRKGVGTPTYRSSSSASVDKIGDDLAVVVSNNHPHADYVEDGTKKRFGSLTKSKKMMAIPITSSAYKMMQAKRNLSRDDRRAERWKSAKKGAEWQRRKRREKIYGIRTKSGELRKITKKKYRKTPSWAKEKALLDQMRRAKAGERGGLKLSKGRRGKSKVFPGIYKKDGKPAVFVRARKNYDGYDILQRAINNVFSRRGLK